MDWHGLHDSWLERGSLAGVALTTARFGYWLWRRRTGAPVPIFGWVGRRLVVESLLITMTIRYKTEKAKNDRLETEIEAAGIRSDSGSSAASSFASPGSTPMPSNSTINTPSRSTSGKPENPPA